MAETIRDPASVREVASFGRDLESLFVMMLEEALEEINGDNPDEIIQNILNIIDK